MTATASQVAQDRQRRDAQRESYRLQVGHTCPPYVNARGEVVHPADQHGLGCPICFPRHQEPRR